MPSPWRDRPRKWNGPASRRKRVRGQGANASERISPFGESSPQKLNQNTEIEMNAVMKVQVAMVSAAALLLLPGPAHGATFRWSATSNRIYVEGGGSATLTDINTALPNAPLEVVDAANGIWFLRANLVIAD